MSVWRVASVEQEPQVILWCWTIYEVESELWSGRTRHIVGYGGFIQGGRVSSSVVSFDPETMKMQTESGRVYKLLGDTRYNSDAAYVFNVWCARNAVTYVREVPLKELFSSNPQDV
jgi:hypothetical protein